MKFEIGDRVRFLAPSTLRKKFKGESAKDRIEFVKENPIVTIEDIYDGEYGIEEDQSNPSWWPEGFFKCRVNEPKFKKGDVVQFYPLDILKERFGETWEDWDKAFTNVGFNDDMWEYVKENTTATIDLVLVNNPEFNTPTYSIEESSQSWVWPERLFEKVVSKPSKFSVSLPKPTFSSLTLDEKLMDAPLIRKESDPAGKQVGEPGAKLDKGKPKASLLRLFSRALLKIAEVGTFGVDVKGYARGGWQDVENGIERYDDAKWRHLLKEAIEFADEDCDVGHMAQEAWNTLARLELILREQEKGNND